MNGQVKLILTPAETEFHLNLIALLQRLIEIMQPNGRTYGLAHNFRVRCDLQLGGDRMLLLAVDQLKGNPFKVAWQGR